MGFFTPEFYKSEPKDLTGKTVQSKADPNGTFF